MKRTRAAMSIGTALIAAAGMTLATLPAGAAPALARGQASLARGQVSDRTETDLGTADGLRLSAVRLRVPLPADVGPHPEACDYIGYDRYRTADGPADPQRADAVWVMQPGAWGSAGNQDSVARNTIRAAAAKGRHIEIWNLGRRGNCVTDNTGIQAGWKAKDPHVALDYYYNGKTIGGKRFEGFKTDKDLAFLGRIGVKQVVTDQYELMRRELPDAAFRRTKTFCGGPSMAGIITGIFGAWDFDGDPTTTADAGYNQCAGFIALDTMITSDPVGLRTDPLFKVVTDKTLGVAYPEVVKRIEDGTLPRTFGFLPMINPQSLNLYKMAGIGAYHAPNAETDLNKRLPAALDATLRLEFSRTYGDFLSGQNGIRDFRFTNAALLGVLTDNNTTNMGLLQVSQGALGGGKVGAKTFPLPGQAASIPLAGDLLGVASGVGERVGPTDPRALYTWRDYDDVKGVPYTSPADEVSDQRDLARQLGDAGAGINDSTGPIGYWEDYFPFRVIVDFGAALAGTRTGDLAAIQHADAVKAKPIITFGADSSAIRIMRPFLPKDTIRVPGYTHIDTVNAAWRQNDGRPEPISAAIADFLAKNAS